jgi:hypothetical protein
VLATDPRGYSTSVTKALADLWPGQMAVIPFRGDTTPLPVLGPASVAERGALKAQIQATTSQIGGDTPLAPALQEARALLQKNGPASGSRVVVITDGNPTGDGVKDAQGPDQEKQIRGQLIPQFCALGIPVSAFGLEIDITSADGQDANRLLTDITSGTSAVYKNVTSPEQLSSVVISLYAQWQKLSFTQETEQGGNYYIKIDNQVRLATIVVFRTSDSYAITLTDPGGQRIDSPLATDTHYEIDRLDTGGALFPGNYTVNVNADPQAQVFALVRSTIGLQVLSPTGKTRVSIRQPLLIQAEFLSGSAMLTPTAGQGQIIATVTEMVNGQKVVSNVVNLAQQGGSAVFSGKTVAFTRAGQLTIELQGTYQQTQVETSLDLSILPAPAGPCPLACQMGAHLVVLLAAGLGLGLLLLLSLLFLFFLRWRNRPRLEGYVSNGNPAEEVDLTELRLTHLDSYELDKLSRFGFGSAHFELRQQGSQTIIRTLKDSGPVYVQEGKLASRLAVTPGGVEIYSGQKIYTDTSTEPSASYQSSPGTRWTSQGGPGVMRKR